MKGAADARSAVYPDADSGRDSDRAATATATLEDSAAHENAAAVEVAVAELWGRFAADEIAEEREIKDIGTVAWSLSAFRYYVQVFRAMQAAAAAASAAAGGGAGAVNLQISSAALRKYAIAMASGRCGVGGGVGGSSRGRALSECMFTAACGGTCTLTTPFLSLVHTEDYHTVVVWERAPLAPEDSALMRVYLEMALDLSRPLCIMGNVCGVRELPTARGGGFGSGSGGSGGSGSSGEWSDWSGCSSESEDSAPSLLPVVDPVVTTDLFLLVHTADVARFMTPRATEMGMRFYEELLSEGKRFSLMPSVAFSRTPWGVPKN